MTGSSQIGFMKGKSCMKNLIGFYNEMIGLVHEEGEVNVIHLHLGKAFVTVFHNTLNRQADEAWAREVDSKVD